MIRELVTLAHPTLTANNHKFRQSPHIVRSTGKFRTTWPLGDEFEYKQNSSKIYFIVSSVLLPLTNGTSIRIFTQKRFWQSLTLILINYRIVSSYGNIFLPICQSYVIYLQRPAAWELMFPEIHVTIINGTAIKSLPVDKMAAIYPTLNRKASTWIGCLHLAINGHQYFPYDLIDIFAIYLENCFKIKQTTGHVYTYDNQKPRLLFAPLEQDKLTNDICDNKGKRGGIIIGVTMSTF